MPFSSNSRWIAQIAAIALASAFTLCATEPLPTLVESAKPQNNALHQYRSQNVVLFTDLPEPEAKTAIKSLEQTLEYAAKYWGREPRGQIICYLLRDMDHVADADLPHRLSRVLVGGVGGATISSQSRSDNPSRSGNQARTTPIVLASTSGIAEHEIVHAYCTQTFGFTGPCWYREGMAEMAVLRCTRDSGVICSDEQLQQLRASYQVNISEVIAGDHSGNRIYDSMSAMLADPKNINRQVPLSDWHQRDADNVLAARQYYLRSWALCYMLLHNPNYASRFRLLGHKHVTTNEDGFPVLFASVQKEIAFEYAYFLRNIGIGYRVDLCSWDWNKKFRALQRGESISARVEAKKGYQASGLAITAGNKYRYEAVGVWSTSLKNGSTEANGSSDGRGQLVGIVMNDFELSQPFPFLTHGTFEAPVTGNLYLCCNDALNELNDNNGQIVVRLSNGP